MERCLAIDRQLPATRGYAWSTCSLERRGEALDARGWSPADTRRGVDTVVGRITLLPGLDDLARLLPWILGSPGLAAPWSISARLEPRAVQWETETGRFTCRGAIVRRALLRSLPAGWIELELEWLARLDVFDPGALLGPLETSDAAPLRLCDTTIRLAGEPHEATAWSVSLERNVQALTGGAYSPWSFIERGRRVDVMIQPAEGSTFPAETVLDFAVKLARDGAHLTLTGPALEFQRLQRRAIAGEPTRPTWQGRACGAEGGVELSCLASEGV